MIEMVKKAGQSRVEQIVLPKGLMRVFPRRTKATPTDDMVAVDRGPSLWEKAESVHISVAFEWDMEKAERLAKEWEFVTSKVSVGGPAYGDKGGAFVPGLYLKDGYTITSRGCPNACWFCHAWRREGRQIRELPIVPGYNVLDNNLLACSAPHISQVFDMLEGQPERPRFTGGFEAARLKPWHVERLAKLRPKVMWFAYDTPDDYEPLLAAARMLGDAGLISAGHAACCYVLIGWENDTIDKAEGRLERVVRMGLFPQAMLFNRGVHFDKAKRSQWRKFAREWSNKVIVGVKMRKLSGCVGQNDQVEFQEGSEAE